MAHDVGPGPAINTRQDMDNDLSSNMYDQQPMTKIPALLKLFFPASARALEDYDATRRQAYALQSEINQALRELGTASLDGCGRAKDIVRAANRAVTRAAVKREADIFRQLQTIDASLNSVDAVREMFAACQQAAHKAEEAVAEPEDTIEISIDGIEQLAEPEVEPAMTAGWSASPLDGPAEPAGDDASFEVSVEADSALVEDDSPSAESEVAPKVYAASYEAFKAEHQAEIDSLRAERDATIDELQKRHAAEMQSMISDYEARIAALHQDIEREQDRANAEKEAAVKAWRAERAELEARANEHTEQLEEQAAALERYYGAYAEIFGAFMDRVMAVRDAYTGNDPDSPVARAITDKIMANDSYGLDDFAYDLRASMEASSADPASLRQKVRAAFLECLQTSSANWLNVMARFHAYGQVPFARKALEDAGLDMALLDCAYTSLEDILAYAGIDLCKPRLFADDFNAEYHTNQPIRNIDTYIRDIASHAGPDTIVDLYLVGYDDGTTQRKPVVSKFA